ncbi:Gfo/Idh/MocA family protein [Halobacillus massiliensis]|uniref:Gfo/Idh/MocA family protein n=1 Tax=Halobacillus massiliensis TaxID=1926286 RepID=UPI0009E3F60A|nr:Gfo/Idh/MocA family oxidoreductase [Halobacillus massiliensis]
MLRVGLIGCGYIAQKHISTIAKVKNLKLISLSDLDTKRMDEMEKFHQQESLQSNSLSKFKDYEEMLGDSSIDVVIIAVISSLHARMVKEALQAGKHVVVEKPLALSIKDAEEIVKLADVHNKRVLVCHQMRYRPLISKVKELIDNGKLGAPYLGVASLRLNRSIDYYKSASWRGKWSTDGGMLINQGIHLVDLLIWFLGDINSVYGDLGHYLPVKETEDTAAAVFTFKNQAKGIIEANTVTQPNNLGFGLSLFCEHGTISIEGAGLNQVVRCHVSGHPEMEEILKKLSSDHEDRFYMYQNFVESVLDDEIELVADAREAKRALEAIFGIYKSHQMTTPVYFPITQFSTGDMKKRGSDG